MRRLAIAGTVAGALLVAVPLVVWLGGPGRTPARPAAAPPAAVALAPAATAPAATAPADPRGVRPVRAVLAAIDVAVPVVPVGVDGSGEMEVPEDIGTVGWYRYGPAPGDRSGSAVLSGHVDDRIQGPGAFFRLGQLTAGDPVEVVGEDGRTLRYRVDAVQRIPKSALPVDTLFSRDAPPHLTLVTCGGSFDRSTRNYRDNVVVTATPLDSDG
jgi:hypothetical protein